jgi:Taurine catabolism dioxygenase TauD, TfdA family
VDEVVMTAEANPLRDHPAAWIGSDLQQRTDWIHHLTGPELDELDTAIATLAASGRPLSAITAADFPLRELGAPLRAWQTALDSGRGFFLVRGFPVRRYSKDQAALAFWIIGRHLGEPVSQNSDGDVLGHVRDTGVKPNSLETRLYKTRAELSFHTDGADIIGLFCLRRSRRGGVSRIASSVAVYNEIVQRRADLAPLLFQKFPNFMPGPDGGKGSVFNYPIVTIDRNIFRMLFLGWYIRDSQSLPETPRLTRPQLELVDLLEQIPNEPGVALDMQFAEGDMQFLKNSVILHARTEYEDAAEPDEKRHLLRLWLTAKSFKDGDEVLRRGVAVQEATP